MTARRFPPLWTIDEAYDACFIVRDANGQALAYVHYEPGRRSAANLLTSILSGSSERERARARKALWAIEDCPPLLARRSRIRHVRR